MNENNEYPSDYISYNNDLEENEIYSDTGVIILFPLKEIPDFNKDYETEKYVSNFIIIGTNGAGVGIFINKQNKKVYSIPLVGMEEGDAILLASTFTEFINNFKRGKIEII